MANSKIKTGEYISCKTCSKSVYLMLFEVKLGRKKYCSKECLYKGDSYTNTFEVGHKDLVSKERRGHSEESKKKISIGSIGKHSGSLAWNWKEDRTLLVTNEKKHLCIRYREWARSVKNRDNWKCKIGDSNCSGRLEAHYILRWSKFPELRYEVNNGITLCHFHHPLKIKDEMSLIPTFQAMVLDNNK